jgi:hypothetical protein
LPTAIGGKPDDGPTASMRSTAETQKTGTSVVESVRTTAANAYTAAKEVVQPHIEKIQGVTQEYLGSEGTASSAAKPMPASSTGIPATSAPLESGPHTISTPYPPKAAKVSGVPPATSRN